LFRGYRTGESDYWKLSMWVILVVATWPLYRLVVGIGEWIGGEPLRSTTYALVDAPAMDDPMLGPGTTAVYTGEAIFTVTDPSVLQRLAYLGPKAISWVVLAVIAVLVLRLLRRAEDGQPFTRRSLVDARWTGIMLVVYGLVLPVVRFWFLIVLLGQTRKEFAVAFSFRDITVWPMVLGAVVLALAQAIYARGLELTEDAEGLV